MSGTEGNIIIISFDFVNSNPLITANFIAHIGWITFLCSSILASVEAERSSCKGLLLLLVQDSFYAPHPKWISHFPYFPFLLFKVFFFPPLASFIPTRTQNWSRSDKMSHRKLDWNYSPRGLQQSMCVLWSFKLILSTWVQSCEATLNLENCELTRWD